MYIRVADHKALFFPITFKRKKETKKKETKKFDEAFRCKCFYFMNRYLEGVNNYFYLCNPRMQKNKNK